MRCLSDRDQPPIVIKHDCGPYGRFEYTASPENVRAIEQYVLPEVLEHPEKLKDYEPESAAYQILTELVRRANAISQ